MGLPHLINQGIEPLAGFCGRESTRRLRFQGSVHLGRHRNVPAQPLQNGRLSLRHPRRCLGRRPGRRHGTGQRWRRRPGVLPLPDADRRRRPAGGGEAHRPRPAGGPHQLEHRLRRRSLLRQLPRQLPVGFHRPGHLPPGGVSGVHRWQQPAAGERQPLPRPGAAAPSRPLPRRARLTHQQGERAGGLQSHARLHRLQLQGVGGGVQLNRVKGAPAPGAQAAAAGEGRRQGERRQGCGHGRDLECARHLAAAADHQGAGRGGVGEGFKDGGPRDAVGRPEIHERPRHAEHPRRRFRLEAGGGVNETDLGCGPEREGAGEGQPAKAAGRQKIRFEQRRRGFDLQAG